MKGSSLLVGDERASFDQDQAKVNRRVLRRGLVEGTRRTAPRVVDSARTLNVLVSDELTSVARASRETGRAIKVLTIGVLKDDGMSWSAAMAERAAARAAEHRKISLKPVCLRGRASLEGDPEIIDVVGVRRLVRLAQKHHLTRAFPLLRPWIRAAVVPAAILLTALAQILAASLQASTPKNLSPTTLVTNPAYVVLALVVAGALLAAQWAAAPRRDGRSADTLRALGKELRLKQGTDEYQDLVKDLADRLRRTPMPRYLIVDGYERLHPFTQDVLKTYLSAYAGAALNFELWVVLENSKLWEFHKYVQAAIVRGQSWAELADAYEQQPLEPDERERLAEAAHHPEGRDAETVKAIRGIVEDQADRYEKDFRSYETRVAPVQRYDALDMLYLLSLASEGFGSPGFSDSSIRERFSPKNPVRAIVLRAFLKGTALSREEFSSTLSMLQERFPKRLEMDQVTREFRVDPGVRRFLADPEHQRHKAYALPDPRLGHLFWALLSYDLLEEPSAAQWVPRLATHILATKSPGTIPVEQPLPQEVKDKFLEATLFAIRACLRYCLLDDVPELLELAEKLVESREPEAGTNWRRRLGSLAWEAYSVLGDETALGIAISLRSRQGPAELRAVDDADALDELFLQSLSPRGGSSRPRQELAFAWSQPGQAAARTYGRVRAFWLAQTLGTMLHRGVEPHLRAAKDVDVSALLSSIKAAQERSMRPDRRVAIDVLGSSIGVWSATLALAQEAAVDLPKWERELDGALQTVGENRPGRRDELVLQRRAQHNTQVGELLACLDAGWVVADDLTKLSRASKALERVDFILDMLAAELFIMTSACAALLLHAHGGTPEEAFSQRARKDASGLVELGLRRARAATPGKRSPHPDDAKEEPFSRIDRQMGLLRVVWASLGLEQLSSFMGLRRAELKLLRAAIDGDATRVRRDIRDSLSKERSLRGFVGLLANALVARAEATAEMRALAIGHGVDAALEAGFGRELATELCLLAIGESHSLWMPLDRFLSYLTRADGTAVAPLTTLLQKLSDDSLVWVAQWLVNAAGSIKQAEPREELTGEVLAALSTQAELPGRDPVKAEELRQVIDLYELEVLLKQGGHVDIAGTIGSWKARAPGSPDYAWVLHLLLYRHHDSLRDPLVGEATAFLEQDETFPNSTAVVHLARNLARRVSSERHNLDPARRRAALDAAVELLKRAHRTWEKRLVIETNIDILEILERHDKPRADQHRAKRIKYDADRHERDLERMLPQWVQDNQYFLLFTHYYQVLASWGLQADLQAGDLLRLLDADERTTRDLYDRWKAGGRRVSAPFVEGGVRLTLSSAFLVDGGCLFRPPFADDSGLNLARRSFNQAAGKALGQLYEEITSLPSIPVEIRRVLRLHRESFVDRALPSVRQAASRAG